METSEDLGQGSKSILDQDSHSPHFFKKSQGFTPDQSNQVSVFYCAFMWGHFDDWYKLLA
jgi:hypothetical protein